MENKSMFDLELEKREEIVNTFHKNYLLEAGAGAGKTTIIVQRVINHIIKSDMNPSNLVVITFTKAAANELAERIQIKALEEIKKRNDPKVIKKLKDVDKIFTGTIHSFCDLILRELPFHANLSPGYEIIEDGEKFHERIWYSFLRDKEKSHKDIIGKLDALSVNYLNLKTQALTALDNPDIEFIDYEDVEYKLINLKDEFKKINKKYKNLNYEIFHGSRSLFKLLESIIMDSGDLDYNLNHLNNIFEALDLDKNKVLDSHCKKGIVLDDEEKYDSLVDDLYSIYMNRRIASYNVATEFINMLIAYKEENYGGKITFSELLYRASSLVKSSKEARIHLKSKYKYFYLDESQDTDPMQVDLIMHLADSDIGYDGVKSWVDVEPAPGALFIVGDPKQSIYRFRRADISIYNKMKELVERYGEVVYLDINFRSSDDICNWVQGTFKRNEKADFGFGEKATEAQAGFKQILSQWDDSLKEDSKEYKEYKDLHLQGAYKYNFLGQEEDYIADLILELKERYIITDKVAKEGSYENSYRKVEYGDIMLLTKANLETGVYLESLKKRGIPALLAGEKCLGDNREVMNLFLLIDALVDFNDNIKIVAALKNSFYLDLETIGLFKENEKNLSKYIFSLEHINSIQDEGIKEAFLYLNEILKLSNSHKPIAFIEMLIENKFGVFNMNTIYNYLDFRDAYASLRQVVEILKVRDCFSLYSLREELNDLVRNVVKYELPLNKEESTSALRVMNIHKAKGLEANIVILVDGLKGISLSHDKYYPKDKTKGRTQAYIKYSESTTRMQGPNEIENKGEETKFKRAELDRLLYVAATRAKSVLIVSNALKPNAFIKPLTDNITKELKFSGELEDTEISKGVAIMKDENMFSSRENKRINEVAVSSYILYSPSSSKALKIDSIEGNKFNTKSMKLKSSIKTKEFEKIHFEYGPRGRYFGTMAHEAIEALIKGVESLNEINNERITTSANIAVNLVVDNMDLIKENIMPLYPGEVSRVEDLIKLSIEEGQEKTKDLIKESLYVYVENILKKFVNNDKIKELFQNGKEIYSELPFTIALDKNNKDVYEKILGLMKEKDFEMVKEHKQVILINGVIDLVVKSKDNTWTILDYKTDKPLKKLDDFSNYLIESYGGQLEGYKILFEELLRDEEIKVDNLLLYSTYMDDVVIVHGAD